ncbi:hypothetical protein PFICI_13370 [Pestalotiopsis fici W106-1]|uniref:Uncharacterized protein n=1 Tax=Pestalotiopsis fici (strain W106-1 / CGMCC3.15140) TaxID=1229662 RepID=W3WPZ1_PESFW|nr:uncharacterized protein PFICI_13370 [Pestalotiopsis fici W106-1]ETS74886.1 hypothetical protein PFICI_13370 [Pestalotiopsis fici W106-1]
MAGQRFSEILSSVAERIRARYDKFKHRRAQWKDEKRRLKKSRPDIRVCNRAIARDPEPIQRRLDAEAEKKKKEEAREKGWEDHLARRQRQEAAAERRRRFLLSSSRG